MKVLCPASRRLRSNRRTWWSVPAVRTYRPVGSNVASRTQSALPRSGVPVQVLQIRTVPSAPAVTRCSPEGAKSTDQMMPLCPRRLSSVSPLSISQTRAVPSASALASKWPSGLNASDSTQSVCPCSSNSVLPVSASQTRIVFAVAEAARYACRPSARCRLVRRRSRLFRAEGPGAVRARARALS